MRPTSAPAALSCCAIGTSVSADRATSVTRYPSRAKRRAIAEPSPGPAPTSRRWCGSILLVGIQGAPLSDGLAGSGGPERSHAGALRRAREMLGEPEQG